MVAMILALVGGGLAISLPLTALLVRIGHRLGTLDSPGSRGHVKVLRKVPNIGGIAVFWGVAGPLAAALIVLMLSSDAWAANTVGSLFGDAARHTVEHVLPRFRESTPLAWAMLGGMTILHITGLVDDRRGLSPYLKLLVQALVAFTLATWFDVRLLTLLDNRLGVGPWPSIAVTMLWIIVVTNAMNFLDNMDALAAGVGKVAAGLFMIATIVNHQWFIAATLALLVGSLVGFLAFNRPPARIFMGDGGSLVLGFLLAVLTARTTFHDPSQPDYALGGGWYAVFMPVVILAIPLYDFASVTFIRLKQGKSPFVGDQQHFSHRLVQLGLSRRAAVCVIIAATAVTGIGGISLGRLTGWQAALVGAQTLLVLFMIALLEYGGRRERTSRPEGRT